MVALEPVELQARVRFPPTALSVARGGGRLINRRLMFADYLFLTT